MILKNKFRKNHLIDWVLKWVDNYKRYYNKNWKEIKNNKNNDF